MMALDAAETELLYERLAQAIDEARAQGPAQEMESLFLAKLAFAALREMDDRDSVEALIELCLKDIAPSDR